MIALISRSPVGQSVHRGSRAFQPGLWPVRVEPLKVQAEQPVLPSDEPLRVALELVPELGSSLVLQLASPVASVWSGRGFRLRDRRHRHRALRCHEALVQQREQAALRRGLEPERASAGR